VKPALALPLALIASLCGCREPADLARDGGGDSGVVVADAGTRGLRVATVNLRCLLEEWDQRVPLIAQELAALNPDVIALQEVCREEGGADALPDLIAKLEAATGETYDFSRTETHLAWDVYQEGIALLTRHTFDETQTLDLPTGVFPRKAVVGRITHQSVPVLVAVTHLSFGDQEGVRVSQLGALRDHMAPLRVSGESLLIAGDLNEGPTGDALVATTGAGYQDAWAVVHPGSDGATYPASGPRSRIDYVLFSPPDDSQRARQVQRFLQESSDGRYPSDHLGVWADLGPVD
jgi:endonuclease/exonuclease/phosphatase family metal-dependent hydrolase